MRWSIGVPIAALAALMWIGCSDERSGTTGPGRFDDEVILSNPIAAGLAHTFTTGAPGTVTFVSLAPGTVPGAERVIIRNLTAQDAGGIAVPVLEGGFDPVGVAAASGDRLEVEVHGPAGVLGRKYAAVPRSRPPVVVRTSPPHGRTDVALAVRPTVVFSEPVDPTALVSAVRLLRQGAAVEGQVAPLPTAPWVAEFVPAAPLEPNTEYELVIEPGVKDLDGDALEAELRAGFSTGTALPPPPPSEGRIAFGTNQFQGEHWIFTANADGTDLVRLVQGGGSPAWSPDGALLAFDRGERGLRVINADGTSERVVTTEGFEPSWAPDGTRLAYSADGASPDTPTEIHAIGMDGSDGHLLITRAALGPEYLAISQPTWSPDGQFIAFTAWWYSDEWGGTGEVWIMNADGSNPRMLEGTGPGGDAYRSNGYFPAWSPDGMTIAFTAKRLVHGIPEHMVATRRVDGAGPRLVHFFGGTSDTAPNPVYWVEWSRDGQSIAFDWQSRGQSSRLYIVGIQNGMVRRIFPEASGPWPTVYQPYYEADIAWSRAGP